MPYRRLTQLQRLRPYSIQEAEACSILQKNKRLHCCITEGKACLVSVPFEIGRLTLKRSAQISSPANLLQVLATFLQLCLFLLISVFN